MYGVFVRACLCVAGMGPVIDIIGVSTTSTVTVVVQFAAGGVDMGGVYVSWGVARHPLTLLHNSVALMCPAMCALYSGSSAVCPATLRHAFTKCVFECLFLCVWCVWHVYLFLV